MNIKYFENNDFDGCFLFMIWRPSNSRKQNLWCLLKYLITNEYSVMSCTKLFYFVIICH